MREQHAARPLLPAPRHALRPTAPPGARRDEWQTKILPKGIPLQVLVRLSGISRSTLIEVRAGRGWQRSIITCDRSPLTSSVC